MRRSCVARRLPSQTLYLTAVSPAVKLHTPVAVLHCIAVISGMSRVIHGAVVSNTTPGYPVAVPQGLAVSHDKAAYPFTYKYINANVYYKFIDNTSFINLLHKGGKVFLF